jgi:hypothetical protein
MVVGETGMYVNDGTLYVREGKLLAVSKSQIPDFGRPAGFKS